MQALVNRKLLESAEPPMSDELMQSLILEYGASHDEFSEEECCAYVKLYEEMTFATALFSLARRGQIRCTMQGEDVIVEPNI